MRGLDPRIRAFNQMKDVDGRDKPGHDDKTRQPPLTPSFFCRLVEEVVYWNTSFLSGKT
jgi:hypothetical protein